MSTHGTRLLTNGSWHVEPAAEAPVVICIRGPAGELPGDDPAVNAVLQICRSGQQTEWGPDPLSDFVTLQSRSLANEAGVAPYRLEAAWAGRPTGDALPPVLTPGLQPGR